MRLRLRPLVAVRLARGFIRRQLRRRVVKEMERLGPERLAWLLDNGRSLSEFLPKEQEEEYRRKAPSYANIADSISEEELYAMVPAWTRELVEARGEKGREWLAQQLRWLRGFFGGEDETGV